MSLSIWILYKLYIFIDTANKNQIQWMIPLYIVNNNSHSYWLELSVLYQLFKYYINNIYIYKYTKILGRISDGNCIISLIYNFFIKLSDHF